MLGRWLRRTRISGNRASGAAPVVEADSGSGGSFAASLPAPALTGPELTPVKLWIPDRTHAVILSLLVLIGLARGVYWVFTNEIWSQVDEAQHYAYVQSLARGDGMPVVGQDKLTLDVLRLAKDSPTLPFQSQEYLVSGDYDWGVFGNSYEGGGVQGPLYYGLLVPVYWVSHPFGQVASIFALRVASVVLSLAAVPLLCMLARRLFPTRPEVWLAAPALLVVIQGFNSNIALVTNDSLVVPVCIAAMIPVADALRGLNTRQAVCGGALLGLALLTKPTTATLALFTGLILVWLLVSRRESLAGVLRWGIVYSAVTIAVIMPYIAWNLNEYGAYSASSQVNAITGPLQPRLPKTLDSLKEHVHNARVGFWDLQPLSLGTHSTYVRLLQWSAAGSVLVGMASYVRTRRRDDVVILAWLALTVPLAFLTSLGASLLAFDGAGTVVGRHLYAAIGFVALAIAAGLFTGLGRRMGTAAFIALLGLVLISERQLTNHYIDGTYTAGILAGELAPVVDQPVNEGIADVNSVELNALCPAEALALRFSADPPPSALIVTRQGTEAELAPYLGRAGPVDIYTLPRPTPGSFAVRLERHIAYSPDEDHPAITVRGLSGDPVFRIYCPVADSREFRFNQLYKPLHPDFSYRMLRAWPAAWYWMGWLTIAGAAVYAAYAGYSFARRR